MPRTIAAVIALAALAVFLHLLPGGLNYTETDTERLVRTLAFLTVIVAGSIAWPHRRR